MRYCNTKNSIVLGKAFKKTVFADNSGGLITSDAGVLILRQIDQQFNVSQGMAVAIHDPRQQAKVVHSTQQIVAQRLFALCQGHCDLNDHDSLRHDVAFKLACRSDGETLAAKDTVQRLEQRITREEIIALHEVYMKAFLQAHPTPPQQIFLDFDATDTALHGGQEERFFHGYYGHFCYLPLLVFCGEFPLVTMLRPAGGDAARHTRPVLKMLVDRIRQAWPDVEIVFRADGGFCRWKLLRWCDNNNIKYIVGLAKNNTLKKACSEAAQQAEADSSESGKAERVFTEFQYGAETWDKKRRVICKAEYLPPPSETQEGKPNSRFIVTNLTGDGQDLYEQIYCARGEMENRIKEQQLGLFGNRMSCSRFLPNGWRLLLSGMAHLLMTLLRYKLAGTECARMQASTLRLKLLKLGARVKISARRIHLQLSEGCAVLDLLQHLSERLPPGAPCN